MYYIRISKIALATLLLLASACKDASNTNKTTSDNSSQESKNKTIAEQPIDFINNEEVVVTDVPRFVPSPAASGFVEGFNDRSGFNSDDEDNCDLGSVGFRDTSRQRWYTVETPYFPEFALLSDNRNSAAIQGDLAFNNSGVIIEQGGSYAVSFNAVVYANDDDDISGLNVFLLARAPDDSNTSIDAFDLTRQVGTLSEIPYNTFVTLHGSGILQNLTRGDYLSLVTNNIDNDTKNITVAAWTISLERICNDQPINLEIPQFNITGQPFPKDTTIPAKEAVQPEQPAEEIIEAPVTAPEAEIIEAPIATPEAEIIP